MASALYYNGCMENSELGGLDQRLRTLRAQRQMSRRDLEQRSGLSYYSILKFELGQRTPDRDSLNRLASAFGVSVDFLLGRTDDQTPPEPRRQQLAGRSRVSDQEIEMHTPPVKPALYLDGIAESYGRPRRALGKRLNLIREQMGHTLQQLAKEARGIRAEDLMSFEAGRRLPDVPTLVVLADLLGVTLDYLVGRSDLARYPIDLDHYLSKVERLTDTDIHDIRDFIEYKKSKAKKEAPKQ